MKTKRVLLTMFVLLSLSYQGLSAANDTSPDETSATQSSKSKKGASAYLETGGERKLEILYKKTPEGDLHLDLYYPIPKPLGKCPVLIYTHGGGWAVGSKLGAGNALFVASCAASSLMRSKMPAMGRMPRSSGVP